MLILSAKLLLILFLPLAAVLAWQWRTRAAWRCALFALGALAVNFAVQLPIDRNFSELFIVLVGDPAFGDGMRLYLLAHALAFGLVREGIRWLTFRYAATSVRSWNEGVLFGLGYSAFATLLTLGIYIHDDITVHVRMPFLELPWRVFAQKGVVRGASADDLQRGDITGRSGQRAPPAGVALCGGDPALDNHYDGTSVCRAISSRLHLKRAWGGRLSGAPSAGNSGGTVADSASAQEHGQGRKRAKTFGT